MQLQAQQQGVPSHEDSSDEGLTLDQLLDLVVQARQGDRQLGAQLYKDMQALAADASQPAELRALAGALVRILVGDNHPDLTGLSSEDRAAVLALLARL